MKPNILFIMTDDQAPWTLGAEGHPNAQTPVLDRMAGGGALLRSMLANAAVRWSEGDYGRRGATDR